MGQEELVTPSQGTAVPGAGSPHILHLPWLVTSGGGCKALVQMWQHPDVPREETGGGGMLRAPHPGWRGHRQLEGPQGHKQMGGQGGGLGGGGTVQKHSPHLHHPHLHPGIPPRHSKGGKRHRRSPMMLGDVG